METTKKSETVQHPETPWEPIATPVAKSSSLSSGSGGPESTKPETFIGLLHNSWILEILAMLVRYAHTPKMFPTK